MWRHVNGNVLDDAVYAADMLLHVSGLHTSWAQQTACQSLADLDAACWC